MSTAAEATIHVRGIMYHDETFGAEVYNYYDRACRYVQAQTMSQFQERTSDAIRAIAASDNTKIVYINLDQRKWLKS